jgi:uncharacterized protein (DUF427 family)
MRSSAEMEDDDNVVHDEESPRNFKTIPEVEVEFTEITNVLDTKVPAESKKAKTFREEAIPLIEWNLKNKKFEVNQEAKEILS